MRIFKVQGSRFKGKERMARTCFMGCGLVSLGFFVWTWLPVFYITLFFITSCCFEAITYT
jgi:hypothetical protein